MQPSGLEGLRGLASVFQQQQQQQVSLATAGAGQASGGAAGTTPAAAAASFLPPKLEPGLQQQSHADALHALFQSQVQPHAPQQQVQQQDAALAALLQQAGTAAQPGGDAGMMNFAQALAASGLLGPGFGSGSAATVGSRVAQAQQQAGLTGLQALASLGSLQALGGAGGGGAGGVSGLHALQGLGSLGGLGPSPGSAFQQSAPQAVVAQQQPQPQQQLQPPQQQMAFGMPPLPLQQPMPQLQQQGQQAQQAQKAPPPQQQSKEEQEFIQQLAELAQLMGPSAAAAALAGLPRMPTQMAPPAFHQATLLAAAAAAAPGSMAMAARPAWPPVQTSAASLEQPAAGRPQRKRLESGKAAAVAAELPSMAAPPMASLAGLPLFPIPAASDQGPGSLSSAAPVLQPQMPQMPLQAHGSAPNGVVQGPPLAITTSGGGKRGQASGGTQRRATSMGGDSDSQDEGGGQGEGGCEEDKLAEARRKNREAQQRFRERQRAAVREAEEQYGAMVEETERLWLENRELAERNLFMSRWLAVRDSILLTFSLGQPVGAASNSTGAGDRAAAASSPGASEASQQAGDGQRAHAHAPEEAPGVDAAAAPSKSGKSGLGGSATRSLPGSPRQRMAAAAEYALTVQGSGQPVSGDIASTGGGSSGDIENVQPASRSAIRDPTAERKVREIVAAEDYTSTYQQFQVELTFTLQMCEENGMAEEDKRSVEAAHASMLNVWKQVVELKPAVIKAFLVELSAPDGTEDERWEKTAARIELTDDELQLLHRDYRRYLRHAARIAQERQTLQHQLAGVLEAQSDVAADMAAGGEQYGAIVGGGRWLETLDVVQGLNVLAEREYSGVTRLCLSFVTALGDFQMAVANAMSAPYIPNWLEITHHILRQAAEHGRLASVPQLVGKADELHSSDEEHAGEQFATRGSA